jgi:hypothetical protein
MNPMTSEVDMTIEAIIRDTMNESNDIRGGHDD